MEYAFYPTFILQCKTDSVIQGQICANTFRLESDTFVYTTVHSFLNIFQFAKINRNFLELLILRTILPKKNVILQPNLIFFIPMGIFLFVSKSF